MAQIPSEIRVVAYGVAGLCAGALGVFRLSRGVWAPGYLSVSLAVCLIYMCYRTVTAPPPPEPGSQETSKNCPACGQFTGDAGVCRHCGHDLTHDVSDAPPDTRPWN
jgi:hypothetical protein